MLEKNLETCLNNSFKYAHSKKHEFVTTEHLLLSILDNDESIKVLTSCNVNIETLRALKVSIFTLHEVNTLIDSSLSRIDKSKCSVVTNSCFLE